MNIGIYIYDNAEVLDFSGPFEVFSTAKRLAHTDWNVFFVAEAPSVVNARGGFLIHPHFSIGNHPEIDMLIVVGGDHTDEVNKTQVTDWVAGVGACASRVVSVCTGAFILAEAGLLDGLNVTTHWEDIADLRCAYPDLTVVENQRWVAEGKFITSAGISAGIDMSLYLVSELHSQSLAEKTAKQMDYHWQKLGTGEPLSVG